MSSAGSLTLKWNGLSELPGRRRSSPSRVGDSNDANDGLIECPRLGLVSKEHI